MEEILGEVQHGSEGMDQGLSEEEGKEEEEEEEEDRNFNGFNLGSVGGSSKAKRNVSIRCPREVDMRIVRPD
jgi:hypothetical protein